MCFIVVLNDFRGFNSPGKDLKRKGSTTQKQTAVKSELGIEPFQGFVPPSLFQCEGVGQIKIEAAKLLAPCQTLPPYLHCCRSHDQTAKPHVF